MMEKNHNIRAVVWDLGGVLLRTDNPIPRASLAKRLGLTRAELENLVFNSRSSQLASVGGIQEYSHLKWVLEELGLSEWEIDDFQKEFWGGDQMDMDLVEYIRKLRPHYRIGLLSNAWSDIRRTINQRYGILDAFDVTIFSAEVGVVKPGREIYDLCLRQLETSADETLFIDDMPENVTGAQTAGWQAIRFVNRDALLAELRGLLK